MDMRIPKLLHQTFPTTNLPPALSENVKKLTDDNPSWTYNLYDDDAIKQFIYQYYGNSTLSIFTSIAPIYGAARADFFRYLLMYEFGGVYIDVKSAFILPLDSVLGLDEGFILCKWMNGAGSSVSAESHISGLHPELSAFPGGEFQQWHIICTPKHPFLAAVIEKVIDNLIRYTPWRSGVGRTGVLRVTGPIAYTLAIEPIKALHKHVELGSHDQIGLRYNAIGAVDHRKFFRHHYTQMDAPIVLPQGLERLTTTAYIAARRFKHRVFRPNEEL